MRTLLGTSTICFSCTVGAGSPGALWVGMGRWPQFSYFIYAFCEENNPHMPHIDNRKLARKSYLSGEPDKHEYTKRENKQEGTEFICRDICYLS